MEKRGQVLVAVYEHGAAVLALVGKKLVVHPAWNHFFEKPVRLLRPVAREAWFPIVFRMHSERLRHWSA